MYQIVHAFLCKVNGARNPRYGEKILNFYMLLESTHRGAFEIASANMLGPCLRHMQRINRRLRDECYVVHDVATVTRRIDQLITKVFGESQPQMPIFSFAIDATRVPKCLQVSTAHGYILGAAYPDHLIPIPKKEDDIAKILLDENKRKAEEIKVCVISFQNAPKQTRAFYAVAARPQTKSESSNFTSDMIKAAMATRGRLLNVAMDGLDASEVRDVLIKFLHGESNVCAATDINHNAKNIRGQMFGGALSTYIGDYFIDTGLLSLAGCHHELYRIKDFASDLLVLRLASADTVKKLQIHAKEGGNVSMQHVSVVGLCLYFLRCYVFAVNARDIPVNVRICMLYSAAIFFTSITNISIHTRRNIMTGCIGNCCQMIQAGVSKPRLTTSEPAEHNFGCDRSCRREFTVCESCQIQDKKARKLDAIFQSKLLQSRDPKKGYGSTFECFVKATYYIVILHMIP